MVAVGESLPSDIVDAIDLGIVRVLSNEGLFGAVRGEVRGEAEGVLTAVAADGRGMVGLGRRLLNRHSAQVDSREFGADPPYFWPSTWKRGSSMRSQGGMSSAGAALADRCDLVIGFAATRGGGLGLGMDATLVLLPFGCWLILDSVVSIPTLAPLASMITVFVSRFPMNGRRRRELRIHEPFSLE